jgi:hypothetical protein
MKIWINRAGQNIGTFTLEEVQKGLNEGRFVLTDLGWQEGMEAWKPLSEFPGLHLPPPQVDLPSTEDASPSIAPHSPPPLSAQPVAVSQPIEDGPPWEYRKELGLVKAVIQTWRDVLFRPVSSFPVMRTSGGFRSPLLFNLAMWVLWAIPSIIYSMLTSGALALASATGSSTGTSMQGFTTSLPPVFSALIVIVMVPIEVGMTFVSAGIIHLCLSLFKGTSKSYEATYRVLCYSASALIFAFVPCVGNSVGGIWALVSTIIGLSKVHKTEGWRAGVAVLLPVVICMGIGFALYAGIIFFLVTGHNHAQV